MHSLDSNSVSSSDQDLIQCSDLQFTINDKRSRNSTYSPTSSCTSLLSAEKNSEFDNQRRRLRFEVILEAATAITQKSEESAVTYLNRGQLYSIQIKDKNASDETITSTLSIDFHSASYRVISDSYWKYWITQQKHSNPRAIDIETSRCKGITDLNLASFDKITFNWNGKEGCKIFIRFKCLSTDFSRIKGVKGIPMRAHMDSIIEGTSVNESCFCKVKLFRDKGAERKNKDDYKQIARQLEKIYGKAAKQSLPLMYNAAIPYSVFGEIPIASTIDAFEHAVDDFTPPILTQKPSRQHKRIMTAPSPPTKKSRSPDLIDRPLQTPGSTMPLENTLNNSFDLFNQQPIAPPAIETNHLSVTSSDCFLLSEPFHGDDMSPSSTDILFTPGTMQVDYGFHPTYALTPDLVSDTTYLAHPTPSIYDVFTPEELQQPVSYPRQDYFCSTYYSNISTLQQQLELHNKTASSIILNSESMMKRPKRKKDFAYSSQYTDSQQNRSKKHRSAYM